VTQITVLLRNLPNGKEENQGKIRGSWCPARDYNRSPPEHKLESLPLGPTCSVLFCYGDNERKSKEVRTGRKRGRHRCNAKKKGKFCRMTRIKVTTWETKQWMVE